MKKSEQKKDFIIKTFVSLIKNENFNHITLVDVAKKCGMTKSGLYYYFDSKEKLLLETISLVFKEVSQNINNKISLIHSPVEKLKEYIRLKIILFNENSFFSIGALSKLNMNIFEDLENFIFSSPELVKKIVEIEKTEIELTKKLILSVNPSLDEDLLEKQSSLLHSIIYGIFSHSLKYLKMLDKFSVKIFDFDSNQTADFIADWFVLGLKK